MPPIRTNKRSVSPAEASSPLAYQTTAPQAPALQVTDGTPSPPAKKKRSHGKARPPGHIPRPPNAFIIFRTEYIKSMATQNSTPEVSKSLGERWRKMTPSQKQPWIEKAEDAKIRHQVENPGYKYKPIHPRDEFGNCIRKPRKPNRPRVKKTPHNGDVVEHLAESFQWLEGKGDAEFPNSALPSDASSASSPPPSPSPGPSGITPSLPSFYPFHRRSSSVPLAGPDDSFFFGAASSGPSYPVSPTGIYTTYGLRRLSKRPSTSMDFTCAGPSHTEVYGFSNNDLYLSPSDPAQWRLGHRRSISAPGLGGEIAAAQFTYDPSNSFAPEANPLTPINPVFGNVFDRFSWNTTQPQPQPTPPINPNAASQYAPAGYTYVNPGYRQQEYITVDIPSMSNSPTSNISSAISPPSATPSPLVQQPAIQHPAPVATFDFAAFQAQISEFEFNAASLNHARYGAGELDNALGLASQTPQPDVCVTYPVNEQFYVHNGEDRTTTVGGVVTQTPSDDARLPPSNVVANVVADLQEYEEGLRYTRPYPEIPPRHPLELDELIIETYD